MRTIIKVINIIEVVALFALRLLAAALCLVPLAVIADYYKEEKVASKAEDIFFAIYHSALYPSHN